jgi:hypothetical protein
MWLIPAGFQKKDPTIDLNFYMGFVAGVPGLECRPPDGRV